MTTKIPTSSDTDPGRAFLPDESTLAQLANEFFKMLPTATENPLVNLISTPNVVEATHTSVPATPTSSSVPTPVVAAPTATTPTHAPDSVAQSVPAAEPRLGGTVLSVPAALPRLESELPVAGSSPFYFLNETNPYPAPTQSAVPLADDRVGAQVYTLPGQEALQSLLAGISVDQAHGPERESQSSTHHFYFVDPVGGESPTVPVIEQESPRPFDVYSVRRDFPILHQKVNGKPLIWLDSAATSQKPQVVIDTEKYFYEHDNSNIHRAAHALAARATDAYEGARQKIQRFLGAESPEEIVFVRGATEAVNLLAQTCGRMRLSAGDEIIVTTLEHHANIVPWQFVAKEKGAVIKPVPINDKGEVLLTEYAKLLSPRTRIVALAHVSNTLGTVVPVEIMTAMAHEIGAAVVIDGAQSVPHFRVNVRTIDCDFFVFSGHKLFGPTGIGALYGKKALLDQMPPYQGGGNMIDQVTFEHTTFNKVPYKFEAGTGNIAGAVGLGAAIDYLNRIGFEAAVQYEDGLLGYATEKLARIPGLRMYGTAPHKVGTLSFNLDGIRPEEVGKFLDREGIAVRAGHHCAQPTMQRFGVTGMVRPSLAFYNTYEEIDTLAEAIFKARRELA
jgi:cysteine desulfurase/selenocysteine lyase